jgi:hypothetical protein
MYLYSVHPLDKLVFFLRPIVPADVLYILYCMYMYSLLHFCLFLCLVSTYTPAPACRPEGSLALILQILSVLSHLALFYATLPCSLPPCLLLCLHVLFCATLPCSVPPCHVLCHLALLCAPPCLVLCLLALFCASMSCAVPPCLDLHHLAFFCAFLSCSVPPIYPD